MVPAFGSVIVAYEPKPQILGSYGTYCS